jgi:hypothetical protein
MESYVLRVYRRNRTRIVGLIEQTANGRRLPFHSAEELWRALVERTPAGVGTRRVKRAGTRKK